MMMRILLLATLLAGCFDSHAPPCTVACTTDDDCPSGLACNGSTCSVGGEVCVAEACQVEGGHRCGVADPAALEVCGSSGTWVTETTCASACIPEGTSAAHCGFLEPTIAALATICASPATGADLVVDTNQQMSTESGECTPVSQGAGNPEVCVVRRSAITVSSTGTLTVLGLRALVMVADRDLVVAGTIDVSAVDRERGPGARSSDSGEPAAGHLGGGGAGFQTRGASGGGSVGQAKEGGPLGEDASVSRVLAGGYSAGGFALAAGGKSGGGGGGALALISCAGTVSISGTLSAGGGGGAGGNPALNVNLQSGAGGGSGGVLLVQGLRVSITLSAGLYANGGGGGGGGGSTNDAGGPGNPGGRSLSGAAGGMAGAGAGAGGQGGSSQAVPATGLGASSAVSTAGGGGGSVGYIVLSTPVGTLPPTVGSGNISPTAKITTLGVR